MTSTVIHAGIGALEVALPARVVTNDDLRARFPEAVADSESRTLGRLWKPDKGAAGPSARFDAASAPYMRDPFRGCVERRWLRPDEKALDLEEQAARAVLAQSGPVEAILCASFFPDQVDVGNAAFLAKRLGVTVPAWNVESACSGAAVGLVQAAALVTAGVHARVLVVTSCTYSRLAPESDTLAWGNGDAAAAFVVERVAPPAGILAFHAMSTNVTCGAVWSTFDGENMRMHATPEGGKVLRETAEPFLVECVGGALAKAGMTAADVDVFIVNTPTAWYASFCCEVIGVPADRCVNAHPKVANVGPALFPVNLALARERGLLKKGSRVLVYTVGSVSNATALVLRWP